MKYIPSILLFFFLLSFSSCSTKTVESELPEPNPPTPVIPEEPTPEKEKMLWFDAEANFERFSKKENITYYLDLAKSTGFNKIVVDVPVHISKEIGIIFNFLLMRLINVNLK